MDLQWYEILLVVVVVVAAAHALWSARKGDR